MTMRAMKANGFNLSLIRDLAPNEEWFKNFMSMHMSNRNNNEDTYFVMQIRKTGFGEKMFYSWMSGSTFSENFEFAETPNEYSTALITRK